MISHPNLAGVQFCKLTFSVWGGAWQNSPISQRRESHFFPKKFYLLLPWRNWGGISGTGECYPDPMFILWHSRCCLKSPYNDIFLLTPNLLREIGTKKIMKCEATSEPLPTPTWSLVLGQSVSFCLDFPSCSVLTPSKKWWVGENICFFLFLWDILHKFEIREFSYMTIGI